MKPSTLTCNEVTCLANFSTFTSLLSLATSRVTSTGSTQLRRFYCTVHESESFYNRDGT